jgi:hypothetical protein
VSLLSTCLLLLVVAVVVEMLQAVVVQAVCMPIQIFR